MYNSEREKKWQRCYQSESGTGELLRVKIQFPQVTHSVHSTIHRLCRKRCIGCGKNVQLCFKYKSDVRAEKMSEKAFYCDTFTNSKKGSVDFNTFILCQYWFLRWPSLWLPFLHFNSTEKCDAQCLLSTTRRHTHTHTPACSKSHALHEGREQWTVSTGQQRQ